MIAFADDLTIIAVDQKEEGLEFKINYALKQ